MERERTGDRRFPDQFGRGDEEPVVGADEKVGPSPGGVTGTQSPRRREPTPGSTTARTTPGPRCGEARTRVCEPARTSKDGM
jgi:hypothetical protein